MSITDRRLAAWLFLVTFAAYAYFHAGGGWNQNSLLDLTRAIVEQRTFAIDAYFRNTGDVSFANGHVYANKAPALSWLAAIPYALFRTSNLTANAYICTLICVALPAAMIPALLFLLARRRGFAARWSLIVALTTALATQLFPFSTVLMIHAPSAMLMLVALTSERRWLAGLAAGLATAMNYLCGASLLFILVRDRKRDFALAALPSLIALAIYQRLCFGGFFTSSVAKTDPRFLDKSAALGVLQLPGFESIFGVTISPYRGVFYFAPVLLIAFAGFAAWWRSARTECALALLTIAAFFAFNFSFNGWEGGFAIGGRYLVPLIPLFAIAILYARRIGLTIALALISFAINFSATAVDPQPSGTIPQPLTQYIVPLLVTGHFSPNVPITPPWSAATYTGHTSVNRLTYDEAIVFQHHAPGTPDAEWTSFNLGEPFFGAGDVRSLLPILLVLAGAIAVILRRADAEGSQAT